MKFILFFILINKCMANLIIWNTMYSADTYTRALRPAGPHILAQWLIQYGFTVKVIDFASGMSTSNLVNITRKHIDSTTVAIGVSSTFWDDEPLVKATASIWIPFKVSSPEWVVAARTQLESAFPKLDWILGGANSEATLVESWIRFHQNPEDQIRKYLDEKLALNKNYIPFNILTCTGTYMDNLGISSEEALGFEWGRGCQFKCKFCRYKNIGKQKGTYLRDEYIVKQDLILNYEKYGTTKYIYADDTCNESIEKVESMARVAQSLPFELEWAGFNRIDLIGSNKATINLLRESGLRGPYFGIESFNKEASKSIGKGWNGVHGKEFLLELMQKWGDEVRLSVGLIVGLNPETAEELDETEEWCIQNKIPNWWWNGLHISSLIMLDSSIFDKNSTEYGYIFPDSNKHHYWENGQWNYNLAVQKSLELNTRSFPHLTVSGFVLADISGMIGKSMKEVILLPRLDQNQIAEIAELTWEKSGKRVQDYVNYQLSLNEV
jgi:hypothetical protein